MNLPVLNCDDCGACCFEQGSPPGYAFFMQGDRSWREYVPEDAERFDAAPKDAKRRLRRYMSELLRGKVDGDGPCCWLNQETKRCRYYEHRPQICRDLEVGSEGCRCWRDDYNVDVQALGLMA